MQDGVFIFILHKSSESLILQHSVTCKLKTRITSMFFFLLGAPRFTELPKSNIWTELNAYRTITLNIMANPQPQFIWTENRGITPDHSLTSYSKVNSRYSITSTIHISRLEHFGNYSYVIQNFIGTREGVISIKQAGIYMYI